MAFEISAAKDAKNDEFYTQLVDIQSELNNYSDKFEDKTVFCNCDDPFESNFVKYFLMNFNRLGLKELIATGYKTSSFMGKEIGEKNMPYILRVKDTKKYLVGTQKDLDIAGARYFLQSEGSHIMTPLIGNEVLDENGNKIFETVKEVLLDDEGNPVVDKKGKIKRKNVKRELYYEAGDFRSDICLTLLQESDIVVTNPPFSLFREFVAMIMKYKKQFLIIANQNAITYKEIFTYIKNNEMWLGYGFKGNVGFFKSPYEDTATSSQHKEGKIRVSGITWFTNLDHAKRHQSYPLDLGYKYKNHEYMYPKYDNYDAIEVSKANQIPCDYKGVMGVPITFLDALCPEQFKIVGLSAEGNDEIRIHSGSYYDGYVWKCGKNKDKNHKISSWMPLLTSKDKGGTLCQKEGCADIYQLYWRIFIKFTEEYIDKHPEQFMEGDN